MVEIWKDIDGYTGLYKISNLLRVKSFHRNFVQKEDKFLSPYIKKRNGVSEYVGIRLTKNGKVKNFYFHVLLAKAFIPNPENKPQVNHKNGIKTDNRLENLEWTTRIENQQHAWRTGLCGDNIRKAVAESNRRRAKCCV